MKWKLFHLAIVGALFVGCATHQREAAVYPYQHPLTSPGAKLAGLPPAAQDTVRAQAGMAEIADILKLTNSDRLAYEVIFRKPELHPPLYVGADGSVLYPDLNVAVGGGGDAIGVITGGPVTGIKFGDLPVKVAKTVQDKAPTAEVAYINKFNVGDKRYFGVSFKDPLRNPTMIIAEDGSLVAKTNRAP